MTRAVSENAGCMETRRILRGESGYPATLRSSAGLAVPEFIDAIGDPGILQKKPLGLLCSVKCPGDLVLKTYDIARALRDGGVTVVGGFHSPMEKECLELLLRGRQPVIVCPARGIRNMRIPINWRAPITEGRLLVLSPFSPTVRRITRETARRRNAFITALADEILVPHASPGGEVESLCREILASGRKLHTFESAANDNLLGFGARIFETQDVGNFR